jgi:hypothetical protein
LIGGVAGNDIATTETFTEGSNEFSAEALAAGADCSAVDAVTALVAAINGLDTQGVVAAAGTGTTVDLTADTAGVVGNDIAVAETMSNANFVAAATELSGGKDGTVADARVAKMDSSFIYFTVAANTVADKNWRKIALVSM